MNDIWFLDPIWAAKLVNPDVDITNYDEVKKYSNYFISDVCISSNNEGYRVGFYVYKNNKKTRTFYTAIKYNLIRNDGKDVVDNLIGYSAVHWNKDGETFIQLGPYTVCISKLYNIDVAFKKHNPDYVKPVQEEHAVDIEYLET